METTSLTLAEIINLNLAVGTEMKPLKSIVEEGDGAFKRRIDRRSVSDDLDEVEIRGPLVPFKDYESRYNKLAEQSRILNSSLQEANFTTKVSVPAWIMASDVDAVSIVGNGYNGDQGEMTEILIADVLSKRKSVLEELNRKRYISEDGILTTATERIGKSDSIDSVVEKLETSTLSVETASWLLIMTSYRILNNVLQKANWDTTTEVRIVI